MRVLKLHNLHRNRGGENESYESENRLLRQHGHEVETIEFDNRSIPENPSLRGSIALATSTIWSRESRQRVSDTIQWFQPDLVHFENTYPLISPSAYSAVGTLGIPVVQSVRNYRMLCPSATFFRDGRPCEDCLGRTPPWPGVVHGCYHDSRSKTAVTAAMLTFHRIRRTWTRDVDRYITLTKFVRDKLVEGGIPERLVSIMPNFVYPVPPPWRGGKSGALYVGRLSREKGVSTLLNAWQENAALQLSIVGDGPLASAVQRRADDAPQISYLGRQPIRETYDLMGAACVVVIPSEWYEPFGRVVIEAFAKGTPVIASRIGGIQEIVEDGITGLLFEPGNADDLAAKVRWAADHPDEMRRMGENAHREYEAKYTPERNYELLMDIYRQAIDHARHRGL